MRCSAASIPFGSAARRAVTHKNAARTWIRKINALMLPMLMVPLSAALRHNCDLNIACLAYYLLYNCFPEPFPPGACRTSPHEDLGDAVGAGELGDAAGHILTFYDVRLDAQVAREAHVTLDGFADALGRGYVNGQAIGAEVVGHALAAADEVGRGRAAGEADEDALIAPGRQQALFDLVGGVADGELAERGEVGFGEKVVERAARLLRGVDHAALDAIAQGLRREIDQHALVGFIHHPIRDGFADADSGNVPDLVVETFQVLHVHGGEDADSGVEQLVHILPALGVLAAGDVAVGELVDHRHGGLAAQHGLGIHLLELGAGVGNDAARHDLQALCFGNGLTAPVRFEVADGDVDSLGAEGLGLIEHAIGFADPRGIAEIDLDRKSTRLNSSHLGIS